MQVDFVIPEVDWSPPVTGQALLYRARVLAPLTLADASDVGLEHLVAIIAGTRGDSCPDGASGRDTVDLLPKLRALWQADPQVFARWSEPGDRGVPWTSPADLFSRLTGGRNQVERKEARDDWSTFRWLVLEQLVAGSHFINGRKITGKRLRQEREELAVLLDSLIAQMYDDVQNTLDRRVKEAGPDIRVIVRLDHLRTLAIPRLSDLGAHNTSSLVALFRQYPLSGLGRCAYQECGRLYIPGAEGRRRTHGQKYCCTYCQRESVTEQRRSARRGPSGKP
jgi:hypothetical protein